MKLSAALRTTHDLYVHASAFAPTQRQVLAFAGDVGIGATGTSDQTYSVAMRMGLVGRLGQSKEQGGTEVVREAEASY